MIGRGGKMKKRPVLRVYETQEQETRDIVDFEIAWKFDTSIRERISAYEIRTPGLPLSTREEQ
jgi:hypothetical protein